MSESDSFTSLSDLINSHLSKKSLEASNQGSDGYLGPARFLQIPSSSASEGSLLRPPGHQFLIPPLTLTNKGPVTNILAEQIANTLKAKELKRLQELECKKTELECKKTELEKTIYEKKCEDEEDYIIDLVQAIKVPFEKPKPRAVTPVEEIDFETLFERAFIDCDIDTPVQIESNKPLITLSDFSRPFAKQKQKAKCSPMGKIICKRYKKVPVPYIKEKIETDIVKFDFSTMSPDDEIKKSLSKLKPWQYQQAIYGFP